MKVPPVGKVFGALFPTLVHPRPVSALQPERLYAYLDALWQRRDLPGVALEVGCLYGGTSAYAYKMLARTGHTRRYICIDTFGGFVKEHFDRDRTHGTPERLREAFSNNSYAMVRRLLDHYGAQGVELVPGDITNMPDRDLPEKVAVCLLDVDLDIPTYEGLRRIAPRLVPGGIVLVDDCPESTDWVGARIGYRRFMEERGEEPKYFMGMGIFEKPREA